MYPSLMVHSLEELVVDDPDAEEVAEPEDVGTKGLQRA